jgi:hypothetical protein
MPARLNEKIRFKQRSEKAMSNSIVGQVPKNLLFRYRVSCKKFAGDQKSKFKLPKQNQLPHFGQFEQQANYGDVRVGWDAEGIYISAEITGKQQSLWCRETQLLDSDGIQVWIDTRDTHNVHRASKFCHWFLLLPTGGGAKNDQPIGSTLKINRSKEDSPAINRFKVEIDSKVTKTGYRLTAFIPGKCLNGWDAAEHRNIGFNYGIIDRELGWQSFAIGPELPVSEDPSLWQTLALVE